MRVVKIKRKLKAFFFRYRQCVVLGVEVITGVIVAALIISYILPCSIQYSFASNESCASSPVVFPRTLTSSSTAFAFRYAQAIRIASVTLYAGKLCAVPRLSPKAGDTYATMLVLSHISPFKKKVVVVTAGYSRVTPITTKKALNLGGSVSFQLSKVDDTFTYLIQVNDRQAECAKRVRQLVCPLSKLSLQYGQQYRAQLIRTFNTHAPQQVAQVTFQTISAATITSSSVTDGSVIYDKPQQFTFQTDKPLVSLGPVTLSIKESNGSEQSVQTAASFSGNTITVSVAQPLPRKTTMQLVIGSLKAQDASGLASPYSITFYISGGPKVTGTTLASYNVTAGSFSVYFDQPLDANQGTSQLNLQANGATVPASMAIEGSKVVITPQAAYPVCAHLTVSVGQGVSNPYGVSGDSAYNYAARAQCHTTFSIGTSVQGRSITAYKIGNGNTTLLFVGTMHGNEQNAGELLDAWLDDLEANVDSIPSGRSIVIIPQVNPDGAAADTRVNADNVDINRNFPAASWQSTATEPDGSTGPYGGPNPLSEPESQALASYIEAQKPAITVDYHSHAGIVQGNDAGDADALALQYALTSGYSEISSGETGTEFDYSTTGSFEDWTNQALGLPEFLVELYSPTSDEFSWNRSAMWNLVKGSL